MRGLRVCNEWPIAFCFTLQYSTVQYSTVQYIEKDGGVGGGGEVIRLIELWSIGSFLSESRLSFKRDDGRTGAKGKGNDEERKKERKRRV